MSYVICFWDKSKIQVSEETGEKLKALVLSNQVKGFEIGGNLYMISGIEKIITKDSAYDFFPKEFSLLQEMEDELVSLPKLSNGGNHLLE